MNRFKRKVAENLKHPKGCFGRFIGRFMNHFNKGIIQHSIDSIPSEKSDVIVEVGLGSGKALAMLAKKYPESQLYGVDVSKTMLKSAGKRNKNLLRSGRLKLELNSIEKMSIESESVDSLFTINTIYFWNNSDKACQEVYRVLKKGSYFIVSFNPEDVMSKNNYPNDLFNFYSREDVEELLHRNNFKPVSVKEFKDRYENYICIVSQKMES